MRRYFSIGFIDFMLAGKKSGNKKKKEFVRAGYGKECVF